MFNNKTNKIKAYELSNRTKILDNSDYDILDWNESQYSIPKIVEDAIIDFIKSKKLNLYSDPSCYKLINELSSFLSLKKESISVFNGSDSALNICFETILDNGDNVIMVEPEYSQIKTFVNMKGANIVSLNPGNVFEFNVDYLNEKIKSKNTKVFYTSNPKNPIGYYINNKNIEFLLKSNPKVAFFIDEAYIDFGNESAKSLVLNYSNLFVFRTFSKAFGMAGLRLGYVLSHPDNIMNVNKVRNGKEINSISQIAAIYSLINFIQVKKNIDDTILIRNKFYKSVNLLKGFEAFYSNANFILIRNKKYKNILKLLVKNKILVRDRSSMYGLDYCFRVTIGTKSQMKKVLNLLKSFSD